ncbi:hypothetical protein LCGC14_1880930 [marine sediment metagenome]|uniref:Uncharacterized protein n=1 Tax=marine sediment metagenome TaxID=412755 RepID=A0A0F9IGC3_9ZZZZ
MKCQNCKIEVDHKFEFAIRSNNCPACGKYIMVPEKLIAYTSLKELLSTSVKNIDADTVTSLIIANFEIKQLFKEELQKSSEEGTIEVEEVEEDEPESIMHDGVKYEKPNKKKAKDMLKKMRDEVFNEALEDKSDTDFSDEELLLTTGGATHEQRTNAKQGNSFKALESGSASVRRSS